MQHRLLKYWIVLMKWGAFPKTIISYLWSLVPLLTTEHATIVAFGKRTPGLYIYRGDERQ